MKKIILIHFFFLLFIGSFASDRYWVGGSGNWSDVAHWSVSDGGQGGAAVPDLSNNVFFTAKSFSNADQIVTVDVPAVCSSMSWKGVLHAPQLLSDATVTLSLYGSLKLDAAMQFNVQGDIYFKTPNNVGSTLYTSGHTILGNIYIDAPNGTVVLGEDLKTSTTSIIAILNGTFNSNDKNIYTGSIVTKGTQIRSVLLGKSTITLDKWQFIETTNLTLNALQASIV
ncbi:MAG: hypothetical protein IT235_02815, partial [Bacteroidia bacterium]|nr:hypothetical protein [Bacteroidia bacterium]